MADSTTAPTDTSTQGPLIPATDANGYQTGGMAKNPAYTGTPIAPFDPKTGASVPPAIDTTYQKSPTESLDQYKTRIDAYNLTKQQSSPSAGIVGSSAPVVSAENATTNTVNNLVANNSPVQTGDGTDTATTASKAYTDQIDQHIANLEQQRKDEIANIEADFKQQQDQLAQNQAKETGTTSVGIARLGGYLGGSASGTGTMINLARTHQQEVTALEGKKQAAIQAAKTAIDDKEFALADAKAKEAKDLEQTINDRKNTFFNQTLALTNEQRQNDAATRAKIDDQLKAFSTVSDPSKIDPAAKAQIDKFYGVNGFTDNYLAVTAAANNAKNAKDQLDANQKLLDLVQKIPAGQKVSFPDGNGGTIEYTGMGQAGDISTFLQTDDQGNGHLITYDKALRKVVGNTPLTGIGKTSRGLSGKVDPVVKDGVMKRTLLNLEQTKDPKTGQYDPDTYIAIRNNIRKDHPDMLEYVDAKFLGSNKFFSPDAINRLRSKGIYYSGAPTTDNTQVDPAAIDQTQSEQ